MPGLSTVARRDEAWRKYRREGSSAMTSSGSHGGGPSDGEFDGQWTSAQPGPGSGRPGADAPENRSPETVSPDSTPPDSTPPGTPPPGSMSYPHTAPPQGFGDTFARPGASQPGATPPGTGPQPGAPQSGIYPAGAPQFSNAYGRPTPPPTQGFPAVPGGPSGPGGPPFGPPAFEGPGGPEYPQPQPPAKQRLSSGLKVALVIGAVLLAILASGIGGVVGANLAGNSTTDTSEPIGGDPNAQPGEVQPEAPEGSIQDIAAKTLDSVVSIDVTDARNQGEGSGVVLSADGVIMTNNHVITLGQGGRAAGEIGVSFADGTRADAQVLGQDEISDIAVLKVDRSGLSPITIGNSNNIAVGQQVIAIGAPMGLESTVTSGIISALNRPVPTSRQGDVTSVIDAIQTDAAINPGNSGGALVNARGALIGVNTAIYSARASEDQPAGSIGLGFAIPVDQAVRVAEQLQQEGRADHAGLGVTVRPNPDVNTPGALIDSVQANGPAANANVPEGALVTELGDRKIKTGEALVAAVRSHAPGDTVPLTYSFQGRESTVNVRLDKLPDN